MMVVLGELVLLDMWKRRMVVGRKGRRRRKKKKKKTKASREGKGKLRVRIFNDKDLTAGVRQGKVSQGTVVR